MDALTRGSPQLQEAERFLALALRHCEPAAEDCHRPVVLHLANVRLYLAHQRGDLQAVIEQSQGVLHSLEASDESQLSFAEEHRALALIVLGTAELSTFRMHDAAQHLEQGVALARQIACPWLEILGRGYLAQAMASQSIALGYQQAGLAIELAQEHGWLEEPVAGPAYAALCVVSVWQGRIDEAERRLGQAERVRRIPPAAEMQLRCLRGLVRLVRGDRRQALEALEAADRLGERLVTPGTLATQARALRLHTLLRLGDTQGVERVLAQIGEQERDDGEIRSALAAWRLAQGDPETSAVLLEPVIAGASPMHSPVSMIEALVLEALTRAELGDTQAAELALEHALDLAEPDGVLLPFLLHPTPDLLQAHSRHRTTHASLISEILSVLRSGSRPAAPSRAPDQLRDPLSESELRVLRYLPTNLSRPEIANELCLSVHTIKTHIQHLFAKLDAHGRAEAVERARSLGLLAPPRHVRAGAR